MSNTIVELSPPEKVEMADEWFEIASPDHFWMEWRFRILKTYSPMFVSDTNRILEIGCGSGVVLQQFERFLHKPADGCDLNLYALRKIEGVSGDKYVYNIFDLNDTMVGRYDTVVLLDVVEHLEDDVAFLRAATQHVRDEGHIVINVPALNALFSRYDTQAGHQRRYTKRSLSTLCERSGLDVVAVQYWGMSLLPLAAVRKLVLAFVPKDSIIKTGFKPPAPWINRLMMGVMKLELSLLKAPPLGTSLLMIAKRRK